MRSNKITSLLNRLASRILFFILLLTLLSACSFPWTGQTTSTPTPQTGTTPPPIDLCTSHSSNPVMLTMYYGSEKQLWINDVVADFNSRNTQDFVSNVESSIIYYGDNSNNNSTGFFAQKMFCSGPSYLSAAVVYESLVVEGNQGKIVDSNGKACQLPEPVVAIYPKEGNFFSDHPFVIPQASWVTPAKKAAAEVFRNFLLAPSQQQKALQYGFRPGILGMQIDSIINSANGVDPQQPQAPLVVPPAPVVQAVLSSWENQRRKVDVMLILDRSGSMNDPVGGVTKIVAAKQGLVEFVNLLGDSDGLGLTAFSDSIDVLTPVSALGPKRQSVLGLINGISANGATYLYDTIDQQFKALQSFNSRHIKVIIVLTDGMDQTSQHRTKAQLLSDITATGTNAGQSIKIFTIAYGNDADVGVLTQVASASGGQEYAGNPQNIQQVYLDISQFF